MKTVIAFFFVPNDSQSPRLQECIAQVEQIALEEIVTTATDEKPFWTYFMENPRPKSSCSIL